VQGRGEAGGHVQGAEGGSARALSGGPGQDQIERAAGGADDLSEGARSGPRGPPPLEARGERGAFAVAARGGAGGRPPEGLDKRQGRLRFHPQGAAGGALPSLKGVGVSLSEESHRAFLTEGLLGGMHELRLMVASRRKMAPQSAALGLVRQLPALAKLELEIHGGGNDDEDEDDDLEPPEVQWPPFIPPSLKTLGLGWWSRREPAAEQLMRALPGMLGASGAALERLKVTMPDTQDELGDGLFYLAQLLRHCSPTLKHLHLSAWAAEGIIVATGDGDYEDVQMDQLRMEWAELLAGVSACRELKVLVLPIIEVETVFPPGTAFARLTHLEISDCERDWPPYECHAGVVTLWEVMASGGLPALAHFKLQLEGLWGSGEMMSRVAPALEAVAGTLTHLHLKHFVYGGSMYAGRLSDEVKVGYELGVAVGKLRRLKDLALALSEDGRPYHAFAQGLAASGGDRPLPLLWRVRVVSEVKANADLLASLLLLLSSVHVFIMALSSERSALLTACGLGQAGYKHIWLGRQMQTESAGGVQAHMGRQVQTGSGGRYPSDCPVRLLYKGR
jgi:hypothetical protein